MFIRRATLALFTPIIFLHFYQLTNNFQCGCTSRTTEKRDLNFRQRCYDDRNTGGGKSASTGIPEQCPAVKGPNSDTYFTYNPRYQAATLEEAVCNFADLTQNTLNSDKMANIFDQKPTFFDYLDAQNVDNKNNNIRLTSHIQCDSRICLDCAAILAFRLGYQCIDKKKFEITTNEPEDDALAPLFNLDTGDKGKTPSNRKPFCPRLNMTYKSIRKQRKVVKMKSTELQRFLAKLQAQISSTSERTRRSSNNNEPKSANQKSPTSRSSTIGNSTIVDCKYRHGQKITDDGNFCGLCNLCWSVRLLPDKYFPRFVNELTCQANATSCISGYGVCREKYRPLNVLVNSGNEKRPKWDIVTLPTSVSCECFMPKNSAMYSIALAK